MIKFYKYLLRFVRGPRKFKDGEIVRYKYNNSYGKIKDYDDRSAHYYVDIDFDEEFGASKWLNRKEIIKISEEEKLAVRIMAE